MALPCHTNVIKEETNVVVDEGCEGGWFLHLVKVLSFCLFYYFGSYFVPKKKKPMPISKDMDLIILIICVSYIYCMSIGRCCPTCSFISIF